MSERDATQQARGRADFDTSRLSNFGKNVAQTHGRFSEATDRMVGEIRAAQDAGLSSGQIEHALLKHCGSRQQLLDVLSVLSAVIQTGRVDGVRDPLEALQ